MWERLRPNELRLRDERGSVSIEVAILAPALILLIVVGIVAGRTSLAASMVADAAHDAARAASLARTASDARVVAAQTADRSLFGHGYACVNPTVTTDTSGFTRPLGQPATVTVTISCTISYADLVKLPGVPGGKVIINSFTSPLDQFRARSGS
ncbi:MAG: pilus assembly protein TadE [Kribbellaceae bacterium]|nr:pilus assembly protein TadE [Kribbellaceae bacterium]